VPAAQLRPERGGPRDQPLPPVGRDVVEQGGELLGAPEAFAAGVEGHHEVVQQPGVRAHGPEAVEERRGEPGGQLGRGPRGGGRGAGPGVAGDDRALLEGVADDTVEVEYQHGCAPSWARGDGRGFWDGTARPSPRLRWARTLRAPPARGSPYGSVRSR